MASNALNPSVVKTELDKVFYQEWTTSNAPGQGSVETSVLFNQQTSNKAVEQRSVFVGTGLWETTGEAQNVPTGQSRIKDKVNYTHVKFSKGEEITKEFFDDDLHYDVDKIVRSLARRGRVTQNQSGFSTYRNAFNNAFPGGDGVSLVNAAHPTNLGTTSNALTAKLSESSLNSAIISLKQQKDKDGTMIGATPSVLLVSPFNYKRACELVDSEYRADTADNNMNVYSSKYNLFIYQNEWVGTAGGGSDDYWYMLSRDHSINRIVRDSISTWDIPWDVSRNMVYFYGGYFRESTGFDAWMGMVGSDGTTGAYDS